MDIEKQKKDTTNKACSGEEASVYLLVDGVRGIYSYDFLIKNYPIYVFDGKVEGGETYISFVDYLKREALNCAECEPRTIEDIFNPENEEFSENISEFEFSLYVKGDNGVFYEITSMNGEIFAIHPEAEYDDETETYIIDIGDREINSRKKEKNDGKRDKIRY